MFFFQQMHSQQPPGPQPGGGEPAKAPSVFSQAQIHQLKAQIMAYRYLARSQVLVPGLVAAVHGRRQEMTNQNAMRPPHPGRNYVFWFNLKYPVLL